MKREGIQRSTLNNGSDSDYRLDVRKHVHPRPVHPILVLVRVPHQCLTPRIGRLGALCVCVGGRERGRAAQHDA